MINITINAAKRTFDISNYGTFLFNELSFFFAGNNVFAKNRYTNAMILPGINLNQIQLNEESFADIAAFESFVKNSLYGQESRWKIIQDFTIGDMAEGTPADGTSSFLNPNLAGLNHDAVKIDLNGSYLAPTDFNLASEGGFTLNGHTFSTGDRYVIWIFN